MDSFAAPFVQGRLQKRDLTLRVKSSCAHCGEPMEFTLDQDMNLRDAGKLPGPIIFVPEVDFGKQNEPNIISMF